MRNSLNKYIFLNILLMVGTLVVSDIYAARPNSKRASRSKSSAPTRKKTPLASSSSDNTVSTSTAIESAEDRSVNGTVTTTARPGRIDTVSATSSSAVDDDTAASLLASNLLACLQSPCYGDVAYEKCFSNGAAESYTRANTTCLGMYNGAANDVIRVKAMNQVNAKIKTYFADACEAAGGRVSGSVCKINVCYHAKAGSHSTTRCMDYNVGKQVTCSYGAFGLSQQDLEYKEEMTSEQLGTIIQSGMQTLSGLMDTGVAIVNTVQASKKLKKASNVQGKKCWGTYTMKTHSITGNPASDCEQIWELCGGDGKKKSCVTASDSNKSSATSCSGTIQSDSAGNYYCVTSKSDSTKPKEDGTKPKDCKTLSANTEEESCLVELSEWTDVAVQEQEASLYKKFTNFTKLQIEEKFNQMKQGAAYASLQQELSKYGQSTYKKCSEHVGFTRDYDSAGKLVYSACSKLASKFNSNNPNNQVSLSECVELDTACYCKKMSDDDCKDAVKQKDGYYKEKGFDYIQNEESFKQKVDNVSKLVIGKDAGKQTFSSATETYNSMQKKVNEEKQKIATLEEQKSKGISNAIASGAQTLTSSGSALTMAIVNANSNTGTMTGACYIGDPRAGGIYFMSDNEVKKLTWKNL